MDERISRKAEFDYMMNFVEENSFDDEMSCTSQVSGAF